MVTPCSLLAATKAMIWSSSASRARRGRPAAWPAPAHPIVRRRHSGSWAGWRRRACWCGYNPARAGRDWVLKSRSGPSSVQPARHHPVQICQRALERRASWHHPRRPSWHRSRSPAAGPACGLRMAGSTRLGSDACARCSAGDDLPAGACGLPAPAARPVRAGRASGRASTSWGGLTAIARPGKSSLDPAATAPGWRQSRRRITVPTMADHPGHEPDARRAAARDVEEDRLVGHCLLIQCGPIPAIV